MSFRPWEIFKDLTASAIPAASNGLKRFAPEVFYPLRKGDRPEAQGGAKKLMVD
jgi:hypothetical protein